MEDSTAIEAAKITTDAIDTATKIAVAIDRLTKELERLRKWEQTRDDSEHQDPRR